MQTFAYSNPGSSEHMLVIATPIQTFVKLTCGDSLALSFWFNDQGSVLGDPEGTLVELFESQGIRGEPLHARLKLIYLDRTQTMQRDTTNVRCNV